MNKNQRGIAHLGLIIAVAVLAGAGFAGWRVWDNQQNKNTPTPVINATPGIDTPKDKDKLEVKLANDQVTLEVPKEWSGDGEGCIAPAYSQQNILDSVALLPGEKLRTNYGDGTEYFHILVCVFESKNDLSPKDWFTDASVGGIGMGTGSTNAEKSSDSINGNDAYYIKDKSSSQSVSYVIKANDKIVLISARTYDTSDELPGVGDFRKFEPKIDELVKTIKIE